MLRPPSRERPSYTIRLANSDRRVLEAAAVEHREYLAECIRRFTLQASACMAATASRSTGR